VSEATRARGTTPPSLVRVRYADTDQMGITYHANYLVWFEVGRTDWLRHRGWTYRDMEREGFLLPVIEVTCRYLAPARYDDEVEVHTEASLLTPVRVRFDYTLRIAGGVSVATGHTVHAVLDAGGRPCRIPERVRAAMVQAPPDGRPRRPPQRLQ
jgi:acyl-CoA thioester hydrolase